MTISRKEFGKLKSVTKEDDKYLQKEAIKEDHREYCEVHEKEIREYMHKYYLDNEEKLKEQSQQWYEDHKEEIKEYRQQHKEEFALKNAIYIQTE